MSWGKCHDCGNPIGFARMRDKVVVAVNPTPDDRGRIVALQVGRGKFIDGHGAEQGVKAGELQLRAHGDTCTQLGNPPRDPAPAAELF